MTFQPATYAEALEKRQSKPQKPRTALKRRSDKAIRALQGDRAAFLEKPTRTMSRSRIASDSKGKKAKRAKKLTDGQLKKKVWKEFSIFIRTRGADQHGYNYCVTCDGGPWHWKDLQAGHFLRGRLNANLFTEIGTNPQCYGCNVGRDGNVVVYYRWMEAKYGREVVDQLIAQNNVTHKWQPGELQTLLEKYKTLNSQNPLLEK